MYLTVLLLTLLHKKCEHPLYILLQLKRRPKIERAVDVLDIIDNKVIVILIVHVYELEV